MRKALVILLILLVWTLSLGGCDDEKGTCDYSPRITKVWQFDSAGEKEKEWTNPNKFDTFERAEELCKKRVDDLRGKGIDPDCSLLDNTNKQPCEDNKASSFIMKTILTRITGQQREMFTEVEVKCCKWTLSREREVPHACNDKLSLTETTPNPGPTAAKAGERAIIADVSVLQEARKVPSDLDNFLRVGAYIICQRELKVFPDKACNKRTQKDCKTPLLLPVDGLDTDSWMRVYCCEWGEVEVIEDDDSDGTDETGQHGSTGETGEKVTTGEDGGTTGEPPEDNGDNGADDKQTVEGPTLEEDWKGKKVTKDGDTFTKTDDDCTSNDDYCTNDARQADDGKYIVFKMKWEPVTT